MLCQPFGAPRFTRSGKGKNLEARRHPLEQPIGFHRAHVLDGVLASLFLFHFDDVELPVMGRTTLVFGDSIPEQGAWTAHGKDYHFQPRGPHTRRSSLLTRRSSVDTTEPMHGGYAVDGEHVRGSTHVDIVLFREADHVI